MTRKEARDLLPIIQAYAEGKTIQRIDDKNEWSDLCISKLKPNGSIYLMTSTQFMPYFDLYVKN